MTKVKFLNQAESFMSESYICQLYGNANKKTINKLYLGSNENKNSGQELNKIEARLAERKQKMNGLKRKCQNVKRKLNNME